MSLGVVTGATYMVAAIKYKSQWNGTRWRHYISVPVTLFTQMLHDGNAGGRLLSTGLGLHSFGYQSQFLPHLHVLSPVLAFT